MESPDKLETGLREIIAAVVAGQQSSAQTNHLFHTCHAMASAFILSKLGSGTFTIERFGLEVHDVAVDCLGDMFAHDEQGHLTELVSYFREYADASDVELMSLLRRLVFSNVNVGIFRLYRDTDPGLARIIRNVKLSIAKSNSFEEIERFGEACLAPTGIPLLLHLPMMDFEVLAKAMAGRLSGEDHVPDFIAKVDAFVREQDEYARTIPIVTIALACRSLYAHPLSTDSGRNDGEAELNKEDLRKVIKSFSARIKAEHRQWYLSHKNTPEEMYDAYWLVVEHYLINRLVEDEGSKVSQSKLFELYAPAVSSGDYDSVHRDRIEYLAAKVMKKVIEFSKDN